MSQHHGDEAQADLRRKHLQRLREAPALTAADIESLGDPGTLAFIDSVEGGPVFPAFQVVVTTNGSLIVAPSWRTLREHLSERTGWSDETLLLWATAPNTWLDGRTPAREVQAHPNAITDALRTAVNSAAAE